MRQERFSPGTNVSGWKGRQDYLKGYPGAAMSDAMNGGFAGGGGYVLEDSYHLLSRSGGYGGMLNITNIPQTYRHLMLEFTMSQQSTYWAGIMPIVFNNGVGSSSFSTNGDWDGMRGRYWGKGWSTGNQANNPGARDPAARSMGAYSNWGNSNTLCIYNYSDANQSLKPYKFWSNTNSASASSYVGFMEGFGYLLANTVTAGGAPSPAIDTIRSYNNYQNGHSSYQSFALYGFGGLV
jgi:hypothetical protein